MASLHELEQITVLGGAITAVVALLAPVSRVRLVATWVLVGAAMAAAVLAGPDPRMYSAYVLVVLHAVFAWIGSRRVAASPVRNVWRAGAGAGHEHVTEPASGAHRLGRVALFMVSLALLAVPLGLIAVPWV